ncbi:ankyrin repeat domain-containing protein 10 [Parasteatoda tepidariorum]|uniref:ankyrin repeat domain-containing protein 10 n=1 Tax=Parasteatoda tepidariorum TaxID=114398 RepID=UPI00077FAE96|nr:ankyrin repeat domain-containing protein 10 [Parasteatoda tepidariorum]
MEFNMYPLHKACKDGDVPSITNLLNSNKYLLVVEDPLKNWSAVHWAAYSGHLDCLRQVVSYEPNVINMQSSTTFQTPLHCAAEGGHPHCVLWLLQAGLNSAVKDNLGETALHKASRVGSAECVGILLSTSSNISSQNYNGQTASMLADVNGHPEIASFIRQREICEINGNRNNCLLGSLAVRPRINRKRTRDMCDFGHSFKRQCSHDDADIVIPSLPEHITSGSLMEHEDLCGSEFLYTNSLFDLLRECHGC